MSLVYEYEYTDTFAGEANYSWVKRGSVSVPELTHYGYTGSTDGSYWKADKAAMREVVKRVKAKLGLTGHPCAREQHGDEVTLRPRGMNTILFINYKDNLNG